MIIGMPISTFLAICIWPFVFMATAIVDYFIMKKQDEQVDDSEFEVNYQAAKQEEVTGQ